MENRTSRACREGKFVGSASGGPNCLRNPSSHVPRPQLERHTTIRRWHAILQPDQATRNAPANKSVRSRGEHCFAKKTDWIIAALRTEFFETSIEKRVVCCHGEHVGMLPNWSEHF